MSCIWGIVDINMQRLWRKGRAVRTQLHMLHNMEQERQMENRKTETGGKARGYERRESGRRKYR